MKIVIMMELPARRFVTMTLAVSAKNKYPRGTTDAPTCTFSTFNLFDFFDSDFFNFFDFQKFITRKVLGLERSSLHQRV